MDAARDSTRFKLARAALLTSLAIIFIAIVVNVIFWPMYLHFGFYHYHHWYRHHHWNDSVRSVLISFCTNPLLVDTWWACRSRSSYSLWLQIASFFDLCIVRTMWMVFNSWKDVMILMVSPSLLHMHNKMLLIFLHQVISCYKYYTLLRTIMKAKNVFNCFWCLQIVLTSLQTRNPSSHHPIFNPAPGFSKEYVLQNLFPLSHCKWSVPGGRKQKWAR